MYKKWFIAVFAIIFALISGAKEISAQQITGGYSDTSVTSKNVKAAAKHAVFEHNKTSKEAAKLISTTKAQLQVVAGLNYRMCLKIRVKGKIRNVTAIVYQDLKRVYSLSSWEAGRCKM